jgi:hypothetical protein
MDQTEAIKQLRDLREQFATVPALKAKWESNRTYCVAPKDVRIPLQMMVKLGLTAPTLEDAKHYLRGSKIFWNGYGLRTRRRASMSTSTTM